MENIQSAVNYIQSNKIVMDFLASEAREKVAADIRAKTGGGTTAKAVPLFKDKTVAKRFQQYLAVGVATAARMRLESLGVN